ncbi:MAG: phosphotransferase [Patescibacteria group bacterium]|nr:phosphotransferase [Patescibacteria group bacterium]
MIFIKLPRIFSTKKSLDKKHMLLLFQKRRKNFLTKGEKLLDLQIELVRNFCGKYRNMSLKYTLITNHGIKNIRAKIHRRQDIPYREWKTLNWLKSKGFKQNIPHFLDYDPSLNIYFYLETPGFSLENLMAQGKINNQINLIKPIVRCLKKMHNISSEKPDFLPIKTLEKEKWEYRHWYFLVRKCAKDFYPEFSFLLKQLWQFRQKNKEIFKNNFGLVHGDLHWGNIISQNKKFKIIDFSYAFWGDPLEDVGGFLAQNDSMFRYYAPKLKKQSQEIRNLFFKNYFTKQELEDRKIKIRLLYFEIRKILEMAAILALVESNKENKAKGIEILLKQAEEKIKKLLLI